MARKNRENTTGDFGDAQQGTRPANNRSNIKRWLSPYLDTDDQEWLQSNRDKLPEFVFSTLESLPVGYTLSSKFDDRTDRWLTTLICDRVGDGNKGIAVTGRGSTRVNSMYTCLYIAGVKLEWQWGDADQQISGDFG